MKLSSRQARALLDKERGQGADERWLDHSLCVGNVAGVVAKALNLDVDYAQALGYIHDIGKRFPEIKDGVLPHAVKGYEYLKVLGYDEAYAGICLKHSFLNQDIDCLANDRDATDRYHPQFTFVQNYLQQPYTIYDKIINLCDLMCTTTVLTVDKRMMDLLLRHGVYAKTQYHLQATYKLKAEFDALLGYNLYNLFPEIKEHL